MVSTDTELVCLNDFGNRKYKRLDQYFHMNWLDLIFYCCNFYVQWFSIYKFSNISRNTSQATVNIRCIQTRSYPPLLGCFSLTKLRIINYQLFLLFVHCPRWKLSQKLYNAFCVLRKNIRERREYNQKNMLWNPPREFFKKFRFPVLKEMERRSKQTKRYSRNQ